MISILDKMYQWWRALGMVLVLLVISLSGIAQISFKKCPLDFSLIPRERGSQKGGIEFVGHSANSAIWLSRYKNNRLELSIKLFTDSSTGVYSFQFIDSIDVGLFNYRYEFSQPSIGIVKVIDSICVGDIYIVNGQSNAESASKGEACNYLRNEFIRTYGNASETPSAKKWFWGSGDGTKDIPGHIGQLGMALAYELMAEKHIPIAIFNGGVGGKELNYFMRDELNYTNETTSYGRLLKRLIESNTVNHVKAILWYQGEKDAGIGTSYSLYSSRLQTLYNAWTEDFKGFENLYLYQIRLGCSQPQSFTGMIQQAQLDFANKNSNVFIISTNNVDHNMDECHYDYKFGYRILAEYAAQQILHYQYQETNSYGIRSLLPKRLKRLNDFKIEIELDNPDLIFIDENCASDFYLNSSGEFPDKIYLENHSLILLFKNFVPLDYHLSYSGHSGLKFPSIQDSEGHGLVSFYNLSDTDLNWNFEYVNTIAPEMPIAENTHFSFDSIPMIPSANGTNDGFYFYTAYNELIVESNKFEDCMLTIAYFNPLGEYIKTKKVKISNGKNRINLSIEKGKIYYLSLQAKGDKFVAYKKMKISY